MSFKELSLENTPQAQLLGRFHGLFPGLTTRILNLVDRTLPEAHHAEDRQARTGQKSRSRIGKWLTEFGEPAAQAYNQYARQDE